MFSVLHICSGFFDSKLYLNLITSIDKLGIKQIVYVPLKQGKKYNKINEIEKRVNELNNVSVVYSFILKKHMRILYHLKIKTILNDIESKVELSNINIVHSHLLYTNGGVAYKIKEKYSIPYISAIRNTDVNIFFKYFFHLRPFVKKIVKSSKNIIFISPSYKLFFQKSSFKDLKQELLEKTKVIPNGIDAYWHENTKIQPKKIAATPRFLFIGDLNNNKNIDGAISFLNSIKEENKTDLNFAIIGPETNQASSILELVNNYDWVNYLGPVYDKDKLKQEFNKSDFFIMLSKNETFGLVYVEAMSQGLPIIYTKNQGIDGYFKEMHVGVSVDILNIKKETIKVRYLVDNYFDLSQNAINESKTFKWKIIANKYYNLYKDI